MALICGTSDSDCMFLKSVVEMALICGKSDSDGLFLKSVMEMAWTYCREFRLKFEVFAASRGIIWKCM